MAGPCQQAGRLGPQRALAAGLFVLGIRMSHFGQVPTPPHCRAPRKLSSAPRDTIMTHCSMPLTTAHFILHACHRLSRGISPYSISLFTPFCTHTCSCHAVCCMPFMHAIIPDMSAMRAQVCVSRFSRSQPSQVRPALRMPGGCFRWACPLHRRVAIPFPLYTHPTHYAR